jgi:hypothetical protein
MIRVHAEFRQTVPVSAKGKQLKNLSVVRFWEKTIEHGNDTLSLHQRYGSVPGEEILPAGDPHSLVQPTSSFLTHFRQTSLFCHDQKWAPVES